MKEINDDFGSVFRDHILNDLSMENIEEKPIAENEEQENPNVVKMSLYELLQTQLDDYKNRYIRAMADYDNLKKNSDKQYKGAFIDGQSSVVEFLLPFFDDFDRINKNGFDQVAFNIMVKELNEILNNNLIEIINPTSGEKFNEDYHDAVHIEYTNNKELDNCVANTIVKGYRHNGNGKIIRYATVSVYKYSE